MKLGSLCKSKTNKKKTIKQKQKHGKSEEKENKAK